MPRQAIGVLHAQTQQWIDQNPSDVVLTRNTKVDNGAGGYTISGTDLSSQRVRLVLQSGQGGIFRRNGDGVMVKPTYKMSFTPLGDVQRGDTLTLDGVLHEVVWVTEFSYQRVAEVAVR